MSMKQQRQGGFLIAKIHQVAGRVFARKLKEHRIREINPAQGRILFVLWREDGIAMNELARRSGLGKSTLTSMLDRLEEAGYVMRVPSREDRRQFLIKRTEKDRALERLYVEVSQEMAALFYRGFSSGEIERFEAYLQRILDNLTEAEAGGG